MNVQEASEHRPSSELTGPILSRLRQAVALYLWERGAVRVNAEEPFRLASGNYSPIYVNCRTVISDPSFMRLFATAAAMLLERQGASFDAVAGGETAGIPYACQLAPALGLPVLYIRKKPKGYGIASQVEGHLAPGSRVLLVEDLITDGGSKVGFLDGVKAAGGLVTDALVLFDRQQGGAKLLAEQGVTLHAVTDRATAFSVGGASGLVDEMLRRSVDDYFHDPAAWHRNRGLDYSA
ncbi:MAG: orotate phosphoribosyltransferase [Acidobacteriota bacterium]